MKEFAGPLRWIGIGFLGIGMLVLISMIWEQVETFDPEDLAGLLFPLIFMGAGAGLMRISRRIWTDPKFEIGHLGGMVFGAVGGVMVVGGIVLTFEDPGGIALILFGLVFVGGAWLARRLFTTPEGMKKVAVQSSGATVNEGTGVTHRVTSTTFINVPENATDDDIARARKMWTADRISDREDWSTGRIEQEDNRQGKVTWIAGAGFLTLSIVMFLVGAFVDEFFLLFGLFTGIVALLLLGTAVLQMLRARKFGATRFHMDRVPVAPGETLTGVIHSEAARSRLTDGQFRITLSCKQVVRYRSNDRERYKVTTLWSESRTVAAGGEASLKVPVSFDLPAELPPATSGHNERAGNRWELEARAAAPGIDLVVVFTLPVLTDE